MLRKPAQLIFYLSTLHKPAAGAGLCNVLKYKADTFYLSTIQKPAPDDSSFMRSFFDALDLVSHGNLLFSSGYTIIADLGYLCTNLLI